MHLNTNKDVTQTQYLHTWKKDEGNRVHRDALDLMMLICHHQ